MVEFMVCPSLVVVSGFIIGNMRLPNHWSLVLHFLGKPTWCILGGPHLMLNWPLWGRWKFNFGGFLKCTPNHPVIRPWLRIDETWLVVWNIFYFSHHIGNFIVPTDELIFFRGVGIPTTSMVFWILDFQKPPHQVWRALTCHDNVLHWELKLCTLAPQKKKHHWCSALW